MNTWENALAQYADYPFLEREGTCLTFSDVRKQVSRQATVLQTSGMQKGDRVAWQIYRDERDVFLLLACLQLGLWACPLEPGLPPRALQDRRRIVQAALFMDSQGFGKTTGSKKENHQLSASGGIMIFTSGSMGGLKAAALPFGCLLENAVRSNQNLPITPGARWLLSLSMHHVAGLGILFRCLLGGGTVVFPPGCAAIAESLEEYTVTHLSLVPAQLRRILNRPGATQAAEKCRGILVGGGTISPRLLRQAMRKGLPVMATYGMTETASQVATSRPGEDPTAGMTPLYPPDVRITEDGEIQVRGKTLFAGYWNGNTLQRPFTPDGWFCTGDIGEWKPGHRLDVIGRKDNRFVSGGENIVPEIIEQALLELDEIETAVVVPEPHSEWGMCPVAFVQPLPGSPFDARLWRQRLRERLPRYAVPKKILPWPESLRLREGRKPKRQEFIQWLEKARTDEQVE